MLFTFRRSVVPAVWFSRPPLPLYDPQAISDHFWKSIPEIWANTFKTNVERAYLMSVTFLSRFAKGREVNPKYTSTIINHGSICDASSKATFPQLTRMLAYNFVQTKVRVNRIAPRIFPSETQKVVIDKQMSDPVGRPANGFDMTAPILFPHRFRGAFYNEHTLHLSGRNNLVQPTAN
ncbi:uncharacterized protein BDR25DRAFT_322670 [Lindgomyces ingoldianus]|uniref:Uncharacterized protein n=1 Tax=Lindgomyces ingoldianus TaxID=673940 RepID=A0ACB6R8Y2_9PLEO|nr:uncharacterized protein BDR25DRAFT_322670 [Lindgomyces ingoldianus]KAF2475500.1 hypothetical protein BDR25DRAFT_322670 [Lindgomyces ingoldianus]